MTLQSCATMLEILRGRRTPLLSAAPSPVGRRIKKQTGVEGGVGVQSRKASWRWGYLGWVLRNM